MEGCEHTFKMRRKTDFKQMFLVDPTLYKRLNTTQLTPSPPLAVPEIPTSLPETPPSAETKEISADETNKTSTQKDDNDKQSNQTKDEKFFDATNPFVKALKEHHEHSVEPTEPPIQKARYENKDNEIEFKQMIKEIDKENKNWNELRKDAVKMQTKVGRKRKQPRYVHYFAD